MGARPLSELLLLDVVLATTVAVREHVGLGFFVSASRPCEIPRLADAAGEAVPAGPLELLTRGEGEVLDDGLGGLGFCGCVVEDEEIHHHSEQDAHDPHGDERAELAFFVRCHDVYLQKEQTGTTLADGLGWCKIASTSPTPPPRGGAFTLLILTKARWLRTCPSSKRRGQGRWI